MLNFIKNRKNQYHIVSCLIIIVSIILSFTVFSKSLLRTYEACRSVVTSLMFYFVSLWDIDINVKTTVLEIPTYFKINLPLDFADFLTMFKSAIMLMFEKSNFLLFFGKIKNVMMFVTKYLLIIVLVFILIKMLFSKFFNSKNNDYNKNTRLLRIHLKISDISYNRILNFVKGYIEFLTVKELEKSKKIKNDKFRDKVYAHQYLAYLSLIYLFNFNVITILLELISFVLYFAVTYNFLNLYNFGYKLILDLMPIFKCLPVFIFGSIYIFHYLRKKIGIARLNEFEKKNQEFDKETSIVVFAVGPMGTKKTTLITDIALSYDVMFREEALSLMYENILKFPNFSWINLELEIKSEIAKHHIINLASCAKYAEYLKTQYYNNEFNLFNYDVKNYGISFYNELEEVNIFNVIKSYTKEYFVYIVKTSLLYSNYSIRVDNEMIDLDNFPKWETDFFNKKLTEDKPKLQFSHILDFDLMRLGKRLNDENKIKGIFEFGVIVITEIAKERGNKNDLQGIKKIVEETNQLNDLFNLYIKMCRHNATVDNYPFIKILFDDQRAMSLGADGRELAQIIYIDKVKDKKIAMPFYFEKYFYTPLFEKFKTYYFEERVKRADNNIITYCLKNIISKLKKYDNRIINKFSYMQIPISIEMGSLDGIKQKYKYTLSSKKIYSYRFSTDCFNDFFTKKNINAFLGINDCPTFEEIKARIDELKSLDSFFINDIYS